MVTDLATLATELEQLHGASLRSVGTYTGDDHEIGYLRDDIGADLDPDRVKRVHEELVLSAMGGDYQEQLFEMGTLRATVRHFEEAVIYHVPGDAYTGVFVSVDADAAGSGPAVIDACRAYLRNQSADDRPLLRGAQ